MARSSEVRLLRMAQRFRNGERLRTRDLAAYFEVSERTIKRDIEALRDQVGLDLAYDARTRTYRLERRPDEPPSLSAEEFAVLSLASELFAKLAALHGTRFERTIVQALEKIGAALPPSVTVDVEESRRDQSFAATPLRGEQELVARNLALLHDAIRSRTTVEMRYFSAYRGEEAERRLDPYHLHFQTDSWYCIGYCHLRDDVRMFAVQRMEDLRRTRRHFRRPTDFAIEGYLRHAWTLEAGDPEELVVRFGPRSARYIRERTWHPSQRIEELPDGGLLLRAHVHCGGEVLRWLLQYGAEAEVLAPAHLRDELAREVREMRQVYEG